MRYLIYSKPTGEEGDRSDDLKWMKERAQLDADGLADLGYIAPEVHVIDTKTGEFVFSADGVSTEERAKRLFGG